MAGVEFVRPVLRMIQGVIVLETDLNYSPELISDVIPNLLN